jgi:hypothetical protein
MGDGYVRMWELSGTGRDVGAIWGCSDGGVRGGGDDGWRIACMSWFSKASSYGTVVGVYSMDGAVGSRSSSSPGVNGACDMLRWICDSVWCLVLPAPSRVFGSATRGSDAMPSYSIEKVHSTTYTSTPRHLHLAPPHHIITPVRPSPPPASIQPALAQTHHGR